MLTQDELRVINTLRTMASQNIAAYNYSAARKYLHAATILTLDNSLYLSIQTKRWFNGDEYNEQSLLDEAYTILQTMDKHPTLEKSLRPGLVEITNKLQSIFGQGYSQ